MPDALPAVSVIIPSKDRPQLVQRAVATALAQEGVELEVIVVDDGSAEPVQLDDPRVRVLRHEQARGVAAARNAGVAAARHPWVAFLDDDDLWAPRKLALQLQALDEHRGQWSFTGLTWLTGELRVRWDDRPPHRWVAGGDLRGSNVIGGPSSVVARRELVEQVCGFDGQFSTFADWDMWLRMAELQPALAVPEPLTGYVTHAGSMHRQSLRSLHRELRLLRRTHRGRWQRKLGGVELWRWAALTQRDLRRPWRSAAMSVLIAARWMQPRDLMTAAKTLARHALGGDRTTPSREHWIRQWGG